MLNLVVALAVVILLILAYAATRPGSFQLQRSTTIRAPADKVFALIADFHRWSEWSPWEKLDPALKRSYSGAPNGVGTIYEWTGNNKVGTGRMEILTATPASRVEIKLDFLKPFEAHNIAEFILSPRGNDTEVQWTMRGPSPFMSKLMGVFISMDKLIGKDFEAGLSNLKALAER